MDMPAKMKNTRSHRFILSSTGLALIALVLAITAQGSNANISGVNHGQPTPVKYVSHTNSHSLFPTGNIDFDYAANMRMHHQVAVEMSQAQIRNGSNKLLRNMALRIIAEHNNEIAKLDRWMAAHTKAKSGASLSSR